MIGALSKVFRRNFSFYDVKITASVQKTAKNNTVTKVSSLNITDSFSPLNNFFTKKNTLLKYKDVPLELLQ